MDYVIQNSIGTIVLGFREKAKHKLHGPSLRWDQVILHTCIWSVVFFALSRSAIGDYIDRKLGVPADFRVRSLMSKDPVISPKLKIFAVDDRTVSWLNSSSLSMKQWSLLLKSISSQDPKIILIDKIFGLDEQKKDNTSRSIEQSLATLKTPVVVGSFIPKKPLKYRDPLKLEEDSFRLESYLSSSLEMVGLSSLSGVVAAPNSVVYGPYVEMARAVKHIGHIHYSSDHRLVPMYRVSGNTVLPHFGLYTADKVELGRRKFSISGKTLPVDRREQVLVNFPHPKNLYKRTYSLMHNLKRAEQGETVRHINPGDVVMILPMMYTGNTDFKDSPYGPIPASFAHVSFVNSILTGQWIWTLDSDLLIISLMALFCGLLVLYLSNIIAIASLLVVLASYITVVFLAFAYLSLSFSWWGGVIAGCMSFISLYVTKTRATEAKSLLLRSAFDGSVSSEQLTQLVKSTSQVQLDAREQVVTIMFLDVVGYSLLAENQAPRVAFDQLKLLLNELTHEVHRYGGVVNKTLGDGLLCLFGCSFDSEVAGEFDHAEKAVSCAISIQRATAKQNIAASKRGDPVYPLRIGLHTASVYLGDLGSDDRIDFTAVGNGVNYAKRMEQACDMYFVLISEATKSLVESLNLNHNGLREVMISIKHHSNMMKAYSYNPFYDDDSLRKDALDGYRRCASLARVDQRFTVMRPEKIIIESPAGRGVLVNFSATGLSFEAKNYLERGLKLVLKISSIDHKLENALADKGIKEIIVETRWAYEESGNFVHGVLFRNLSEDQRRNLVSLITAYDQNSALNDSA